MDDASLNGSNEIGGLSRNSGWGARAQAHLPPFARRFSEALKVPQLIGWRGLDVGYATASGSLLLA